MDNALRKHLWKNAMVVAGAVLQIQVLLSKSTLSADDALALLLSWMSIVLCAADALTVHNAERFILPWLHACVVLCSAVMMIAGLLLLVNQALPADKHWILNVAALSAVAVTLGHVLRAWWIRNRSA